MNDQYEAKAKQWEKDRDLIGSLRWQWTPANESADKADITQPGVVSCELHAMPEGHTAESLAALITAYDEDLKPVILTGPSGTPTINLHVGRLTEFTNSYGYCFSHAKEKAAPSGQSDKKQLKDYNFSWSRKGGDIYVFCDRFEDSKRVLSLLGSNNVPTKGVTLVEGQYRINISASQQPMLEQLGMEIHPFSSKEARARRASLVGGASLA